MARILFIGLGELGSQIFDMVVRIPGNHTFLVAGRNEVYLQQRTNLSVFAAIQLGSHPDVHCTSLDLMNVDQTAQVISQFRPDIIFCSATLQRWSVLSDLPRPLADRLYQAQMGPWLPLHLLLVYKLMIALQQTGRSAQVVNATYPDVVNAVLGKVHLAPTTGIGDLANNIPALRQSIALKLNQPLESVDVRFFAQRYLSYRISRTGDSGDAPYYLMVMIDGKDITHVLDRKTIFDLLPTTLKRASGHLMTVASAAVIMNSFMNDTDVFTHAPGPKGLPGRYPVKVRGRDIHVNLPDHFTLEQAILVNKQCMRFDGIEKIDEKGTVHSRNGQCLFSKRC